MKHSRFLIFSLLFPILLLLSNALPAYAAPSLEDSDYAAQAQERKSLPVQSNQIENWPEGPAIGAESAILMEANTGVILYAKNIHEKLYPASTTKLLTCLIAAENSTMDETVTFSQDAVFSIERGSSNMGIDAGQALSMEECLYGILVASANEVANAVAEHVAGSMDAFAEMMNEKAAALGCTDSHFVNAHGLFDENHYTSSYDLAIIASAFFQNELLAKIGNTTSHHFVPTAGQPDDFIVRNKHQLITGAIPYEGIKGGKTGYTDEARQTLVTCAEQNGMKLICVIMKEESPEQFYDTVKLFDYGFTNFSAVNVAENETKYIIQNSNFFNTSNDIFGNSEPILTLDNNSTLILPKSITFEELDSEISYDTSTEKEIARISYSYHDTFVGTASIKLAGSTSSPYEFTQSASAQSDTEAKQPDVIVINIKTVILLTLLIAIFLIFIVTIHSVINNYNFSKGTKTIRKHRKSHKRNRKEGPYLPSSRFKDFDL